MSQLNDPAPSPKHFYTRAVEDMEPQREKEGKGDGGKETDRAELRGRVGASSGDKYMNHFWQTSPAEVNELKSLCPPSSYILRFLPPAPKYQGKGNRKFSNV